MTKLRRGDIYYANLNPVVGSEQGDTRPVLCVQNNAGNTHSPTVVVVPLTRKVKKGRLPTHVRIPQSCGLDADSLALAEQIRTIDRSRLGNYVGRIDGGLQAAIDKALSVSVGLSTDGKQRKQIVTLTLCPRCQSGIERSGYLLVRRGWQEHREDCCFCQAGKGWAFGVFDRGWLQ